MLMAILRVPDENKDLVAKEIFRDGLRGAAKDWYQALPWEEWAY